ncbi:MAG TPA: hypothetical protein VLS93_19350 [Anaeromyxobacteraceae bacterium]|nr:hypothetical protein [Anaeromyxobacteraceae bacterium]
MPLQLSMLRRRVVRCHGCGLRWIPERAPKGCPACGAKDLRRRFEPFHLGLLLLVLALGSGAVELARAAATPDTARIQRRLVASVVEGPQRGRRITLRRGDVVEVKSRDGSTLLVEDAQGNRVRLKQEHVQLR